jgi:hypothetical protein
MRGMRIEFGWEFQKKRDHTEFLDVSRWIILISVLEMYDGKVWIGLIWLRIGISRGLF